MTRWARLVARDQQQPVNAIQRRAQGPRARVVRLAHLHALRGEVSGLACGAHDSDHLGRLHAASQKTLNRETPYVSRGSSDGIDRH
jgi:hypothetical protein